MKKSILLCLIVGITQFIYAQSSSFITEWLVPSDDFEIDIPINPQDGLVYNYDIDWGDGETQCGLVSDASHQYESSGTYTVTITGDFPAIFMKASRTKENLINISQWGVEWETMTHAFSGCVNLGTISATDVPDLSGATDMSYMFHNCINMQGGSGSGSFSSWDVSTITNMRGTFFGAETFDRQITTWEVDNVTDMTSMFQNAKSYNRSMKWWETSSLEKMSFMFAGAESFNRNVFKNFDVSNVQEFDGVFKNALAFEGKDPHDTDPGDKDISDWVMSSATSLNSMFSGAVSFNYDISNWVVSSVEDFSYFLNGAISFNQDLVGWDISSAVKMDFALSGSGINPCNYEATLDDWSTTTANNIEIGVDGLRYFDDTGRDALETTNSWTFIGDINTKTNECGSLSDDCGIGESTLFILVFDLSIADVNQTVDRWIEIPVNGTNNLFDVDWENDGIWDDENVTSTIQKNYSSNSNCQNNYEVAIRASQVGGNFTQVNFSNSDYAPKLVEIRQWGCIEWSTFSEAFRNCINVIETATDAPDLTNVTNMSYMFANAQSLTGDFNNWNTENVTQMDNLFNGATVFDGAIDNWNVSNVTEMQYMFEEATSFDQDLSNWVVSSCTNFQGMFNDATSFNNDDVSLNDWSTRFVTDPLENIDMSSMFNGASSFNANISDWNVTRVTDMNSMFQNAVAFNRNISAKSVNSIDRWNVGNVVNMSNMFNGATIFDQDIGDWDVSNVTNMSRMFQNADVFDQDLSDWAVNEVANFTAMFYDAELYNNDNEDLNDWSERLDATSISMRRMFSQAASFDADISQWETDNVVDMSYMFEGGIFNQDISQQTVISTIRWNVENVTNMEFMFSGNTSFDKDIGNWNVSGVTNMDHMFSGASSFNFDLAGWDLSSVIFVNATEGGLVDMLNNCGMSTANYDATLIGWADNPNTPSGLRLGAFGLTFCDYRVISHSGSGEIPDGFSAEDYLEYAIVPGSNPTITGLDWTITGHSYSNCSSLVKGNQLPVNVPTSDIVQINNTNGFLQIIPKVLENKMKVDIRSWSLYNLNGQLLQESSNSEIEVTGLTPGIYLLNLNTSEGMKSEKITIQ